MAKSKKTDLVISNSDDFDQQEYDTAVGKLIRHYKKQKQIRYDELTEKLAKPYETRTGLITSCKISRMRGSVLLMKTVIRTPGR